MKISRLLRRLSPMLRFLSPGLRPSAPPMLPPAGGMASGDGYSAARCPEAVRWHNAAGQRKVVVGFISKFFTHNHAHGPPSLVADEAADCAFRCVPPTLASGARFLVAWRQM